MLLEFLGGLMVKGSSIVTAVAQGQSLAWELPHAVGAALKKKKSGQKIVECELFHFIGEQIGL